MAAVVVLGGCSGPGGRSSDAHALVGPTYWRKVSVAGRLATDFTIGVATASNDSDEPLTLLHAELTDVHGVELVGTDVIRPGHLMDSFGVWNGYPPRQLRSAPPQLKVWRIREPIEGNRVLPGEKVAFVLHLTGVGHAGPLRVTYRTADGAEETWTSNIHYAIRKGR